MADEVFRALIATTAFIEFLPDDDELNRPAMKTLDYVAHLLDELDDAEKARLVQVVERERESVRESPLVDDAYRHFLDEFAVGFGLVEPDD